MTSFYEQIEEYIDQIDGTEKRKSLTDIKNNNLLKNFSKYIRGGLSKMKKTDVHSLIDCLRFYKLNRYFLEDKEIIPDEEQKHVICAPLDKNIRIIAGAGTGKTTTIICRIKYLLDNVVTPDRILVLTFNVEARKNLERMISLMIGFDINVEVRTIDSFCRKIINDFNQMFEEDMSTGYSLSELGIMGKSVMDRYGETISRRYEYVFFDEFQDVNEEQFNILKIFVKYGSHLTVIGDDSQNIYQFRGSDNHYIINFDRIFENTKTYQITTNYRSTQNIISMANHNISHNVERLHKEIKPTEKNRFDGTVELKVCEKEKHQIKYVINMIREYIGKGVMYEEMAILSRNSMWLKIMETELQKLKIPHCALIDDKFGDHEKQTIIKGNVVVSTIHKAKGLEWKIVFILGLMDTQFPSQMNNNLKNIEEERRLMHVAITRAKEIVHFVTNLTEIPLSRFLKEIRHHLTIKMDKYISDEKLFDHYDKNDLKKNYSVTDIIDMLNGSKLDRMRRSGLLPRVSPKITTIFPTKLAFHENIKQNAFESDFGIYCDYLMTRQLMINNEQKLKDSSTENIIYALHMTDCEKDLYEKYELDYYFANNKFNVQIPDGDKKIVDQMITNIKNTAKNYHDRENIDVFLKSIPSRVSDFHYPEFFMKKLRSAYENFINPNLTTTTAGSDIFEDVYFVSLCRKFNGDRRRLVYRNIYDIFQDNGRTIVPRIDQYIEKIRNNKILCKLFMKKEYKIDKQLICLSGELDYIDLTNHTLVDIKCSECDYKVEWLVQLLSYYALLKQNDNNGKLIDIKKLAIVNIMSGQYLEFEIPADYNWEGLLDYYGKMIKDNLNGCRISDMRVDCQSVGLPKYDHNKDISSNDRNINYTEVALKRCAKKYRYMVLDVENNTTNGSIVQLAYIIYDHDGVVIRQVSQYIRDHPVDKRCSDITGITNDILLEKGIVFKTVITEFLNDLNMIEILIGHHLHTDVQKIKNNLAFHRIKPSYDIFDHIVIRDTNILFRSINKENKKPSIRLEDMYMQLYGETIDGAHDALIDVIHTWKCYQQIDQLLGIAVKPIITPKKVTNRVIRRIDGNDQEITSDVLGRFKM